MEEAAGVNASATDLLVSSEATGSLASAHVSSTGPWASAATRPGGSVQDAGVDAVQAGPQGDWHVRFKGARFQWPEGVLLLVLPDDHPGDQLPFYLSKSLGSDELATVFGPFSPAPTVDMFVARGQHVAHRSDEKGAQALEVTYEYDGDRWHQWFFWVDNAAGTWVVKAQGIEDSGHGLDEVAKAVTKSLGTDTKPADSN